MRGDIRVNNAIHSVVGVIGIAGLPARYGGFETLVEQILPRMTGVKALVFCEKRYAQLSYRSGAYVRRYFLPLPANGALSVLYDFVAICVAVKKGANVLLLLGVSGAWAVPLVRLFKPRIKVICNIDGIEWRRQKWGCLAKAFLKSSESMAVRYSHSVISDNAAITDYLRSNFGIAPVEIAYGGDHLPVSFQSEGPEGVEKDTFCLALCRIEPENNVHVILDACSHRRINLVFIGNWGNSKYGRLLKERYHGDTIRCLDAVYDPSMLSWYRANCTAYIHGHSAGGTNPSLVEAMFFAKHIVAYECEYNRATLDNRGRYFTDRQDLISKLDQIFSSDSRFDDAVRAIATSRYNWAKVAADYQDLIEIQPL